MTSSASIAASSTVQGSPSMAIGTTVATIVARPTAIARRLGRKAAAKKSGTEASPMPSGSSSPTVTRMAA